MRSYGEWRRVKSSCINCVAPIDSRPIFGFSICIHGIEPMDYRHREGAGGCTKPLVYSGWNKYREWKEAVGNE